MKMEDKIIGYIEEGVVIDHLPQGKVWRVAEILGVNQERQGRVSLGDGYQSKKLEGKGVLKIEKKDLCEYDLNLIALVAKEATINFIEGGKRIKKIKAQIPSELEGVILCTNDNCISNDPHEKISSKIEYNGKVFSCHYCRTSFQEKDLKFLSYQTTT